jgi:hypothetical protein
MQLRMGLLAGGIALAGVTAYLVRHPVSSWGATPQEVDEAMPGDEVIASPRYAATHAVTINVPSTRVWPWVAQMGQGRGGLYSYDWLENLLGLDIHSLDHIDPALQTLKPGDTVRLVPEGSQPDLSFQVLQVEPPHLLVLGPRGSRTDAMATGLPYPTWAFMLRDQDGRRTRLIARFRSDFESTLVNTLANKVGLAPIHLVMERRMLLGIKERAERHVD